MASESEQNVRGTPADIVALIRKCLDVLDVELTRRSNRATPTMPDEALLCPVLNAKAALDSLEAEANREKAEAEADALAVGGIVEAARHKPGNAAAMREALEELVNHHCRNCPEDTQYGCGVNIGGLLGFKCTLLKQARAALSAPARNCDVYTHDEALEVWAAENENERNGCFDEWLYHVAAERKGEGDGK